jgi:hypothetical protein
MQKQASLLFGLTLIVLGVLALAGNLYMQNALDSDFRAWPLFVVGAGLLFCIAPILFRHLRGLGGLYIPGIPVLVTGGLLYAASIGNNWGLWGQWWPLEVIALGLGFLLAAIFLQVIWLIIPAFVVGLTGLALLFCALSGQWVAWAVLWTIVPLSVGLPLLIIGLLKRLDGVRLAGLILSGIAGVLFAALSTLLANAGWAGRLAGPVIIIVLGGVMLVSALAKRTNGSVETQTKQQNA